MFFKKPFLNFLLLAGGVIVLSTILKINPGLIFSTIYCAPPVIETDAEIIEDILDLVIALWNCLPIAQVPNGGYDIIHLDVFEHMVNQDSFYFWFREIEGLNVLGVSVDNISYTVHPHLVCIFLLFTISSLIMFQY